MDHGFSVQIAGFKDARSTQSMSQSCGEQRHPPLVSIGLVKNNPVKVGRFRFVGLWEASMLEDSPAPPLACLHQVLSC